MSEVDLTQNDPGEGPRHVAVILLLYYGSVSFLFLPLVPQKLTSNKVEAQKLTTVMSQCVLRKVMHPLQRR